MKSESADWVRLRFASASRLESVEGNCGELLGVPATALSGSRDPFRLLPPEIGLLSGSQPKEPSLITCGDLLAVAEPGPGPGFTVLLIRRIGKGDTAGTVDELSVGVAGVDSSGVVRLWNRTMTEIFHVPGEMALGSTLDGVLPQPVLFTWSSVFAAVMEGRQVRVEIRPGQDRRIEAAFGMGGPGMLGTFSDTSDSFQTEKRLRTARRMNQTYLQTVRTGLVMFGPDYRLLVANRAFGEIFGLREVLLGMPIYEIVPAECFAELERNGRLLFEGNQEVPPVTVACRSRGGSELVVVQTFKPVRSEDEESFLVVGVFDDLSRQAAAEAEAARLVGGRKKLSSLVSAVCSAGLPAGSTSIAEDLCSSLGAPASAVYLSQPYSTTRLTGTAGQWSTSLPPDFSDLHLPPTVWSVLPGSVLSGHELGSLRGVVEFCVVLPVGLGSSNRGFLLAACRDQKSAEAMLQAGGMIAEILRLRSEFVSQSSQLEQVNYFLERHRRFLRDFISAAEVPVAVFGEDWRVVHWNRAMEAVTACTTETARKRTAMVMDLLFGSVGGVASARKLVRRFGTAETPAVWDVRRSDGTSISMAWRLFRADAAEADSMEAMTVLIGAPVAVGVSDRGELESVAERFDALNRGLIRLAASDTLPGLAETMASVAAAISGSARVTVDLETPEGRVTASNVPGDERGADEDSWSVPLRAGSTDLGTIRLEGGSSASLVTDFAKAAARVAQRLRDYSLGSRLDPYLRSRGGYLLCDTDGQILLSCMGILPDGAPLGAGSLLADHAGRDSEILGTALDTAVRLGRSAFLPAEGAVLPSMLLTAIGGAGPDAVLVAMPLTSDPPPELLPSGPESWTTASGKMLAVLPAGTASAAGRIGGISRVLGRDDPVRPELNALSYDFAAIRRTALLLWLVQRSVFRVNAPFGAAKLLDDLAERFIAAGRRPPDISMESDLPMLVADESVLSEAFLLLAELGGRDDMASIAVSSAQGSSRHPPIVSFSLSWKKRVAGRAALRSALESMGTGAPDSSATLALVELALKLSGCPPVIEESGLGLTVPVPSSV